MRKTIAPQDFPEELNDLVPKVRQKAVEIANELLEDDDTLTARQAIKRAVALAERWYFDQAG
jgi:uncharacterized protein YdaT